MCGIAGFIDSQCSRCNAERLIENMCMVIRHRGPDDQGTWIDDGVAMGIRRLSIIDLAGGHQPIFNEDQSMLVVLNGEIYNYLELQKEFRKRGHFFSTNTDTEVIIHAYEEYGDNCVNHLRGMFSFVIWDRSRQRLLCARDRFGKKPLNYYWDGQRLIFSSEIKSILEAGIPREINFIALDEYLVYGNVPSPNTLFKNVLKLPAAHILIYEDGKISTKRYWEPPSIPTYHDEAVAIEHTRALLKEAVQIRLRSDVPLGAFLSGGIDSSIVVALMSQMIPGAVKTFSIGFEEDEYNELPYARQVAKLFGTDHHEFVVRPDIISVLPEMIWAYDEPFADVSMLPTYYVSRLAREHVTVVLTGDGGDEIFGGYKHYQRELSIERIPPLIRLLLQYGSALMPEGMRGKKRLGTMYSNSAVRWIGTTMPFSMGSRHFMYDREYFANVRDHNPFERYICEYHMAPDLDRTTQMQYADICTYLTNDILVKLDKASMLNSLETRTPLLDHYLAEYVLSLPSTIRIRNGVLKHLLKKVAADVLPAEILARAKKGFAVPLKHWFRGNLINYAHDLLDSPRARQRGIFDPQFIHNLLESHVITKIMNRSEAIWALLCLELWFQTYIDEPPIYFDQSTPSPINSHHQ